MIEDVLRTMRAEIAAHLAAEQAVVTAYTTARSYPATTLRAIATGQIHIIDPTGGGAQFQAWPVVCLYPEDSPAKPWAAGFSGSGRKDYAHAIAVGLFLDGQDPDTMALELYRTARALEVVLERDIGNTDYGGGYVDSLIMVTVDAVRWFDKARVEPTGDWVIGAELRTTAVERVKAYAAAP